MGSYATVDFNVKRIAIIGAGPVGLAAAKHLLARRCFESVVIFEQQPEVGGIWYYNRTPSAAQRIPQTSPFCAPDAPLPPEHEGEPPIFTTPMYNKLHANIPKTLMQYHGIPFPESSWTYPSREDILDYVTRFAQDIRHLIKFCFKVDRVSPRQEEGRERWDLQATSTKSDESFSGSFDAVIIANGHYSTPFLPDVKGIRAFHEAHPGVVTHSKSYRVPDIYRGKKVVVVGNGPSGLDIARQISQAGARTIMSVQSSTPADKLAHVGASEAAAIDEFLPSSRGIRFADGAVEEDVDAVIYCTGFLFSYPFLPELEPELLTSGRSVRGLYQHLFSRRRPTLAFPGLLMKAIPFPLAEAQSAAVSAVWSNTLRLPSREEMEEWERKEGEVRGEALHTFGSHGEDGHHLNMLHDWVATASAPGREAPYWDDEKMWQRSIFGEAKLRFEQQGGTATSLAEIGYVYPGKGSW